MPRATLSTIEYKLDQVIQDVDKKVDKETLVLELESIKKDITAVRDNVTTLNGYGKWLITLIMAAVVTAILKLVLVP